MSNGDTRPLLSAMPKHLEPIYDRAGPEITRLVQAVFDDVLAAGTSQPAAEVENDALSLASQIVAHGVLTLTVIMAARKQLPLSFTARLVSEDVEMRLRQGLELLAAADQAKGATRQ